MRGIMNGQLPIIEPHSSDRGAAMKRQKLINDFHRNLIKKHDVEHGYAISGWSSQCSQNDRFDALLRTSRFSGGDIIDYGCGPGDLYNFLRDKNILFSYSGIDQSIDMVHMAKKKHGDHFSVIPIDSIDFPDTDYIFASGIFQFIDDDNRVYYNHLIRQLFRKCRKAVVVNFLSSERKIENTDPRELYMNPSQVVSIAQSITKFWSIDHSYHPGGGDVTLALFRMELYPEWARPGH